LFIYETNKIGKAIACRLRTKRTKDKQYGDLIIEISYEKQYDLYMDYYHKHELKKEARKQKQGYIQHLATSRNRQLACFKCSRGTTYVYHQGKYFDLHRCYSFYLDHIEGLCRKCNYYGLQCNLYSIKAKAVIYRYIITQIWLIDTYYTIRYHRLMMFYITWIPEEVLDEIKILLKRMIRCDVNK
jgi:hypothetical protein